MNTDNIDLNLFKVLDAVMRERSITGAAARLALTQPATSNALKRLRDQLDDPLFVRTAEGMRPTPLTLSLAPVVEAALASLKGAMAQHGRFDPLQSTRTFNLLMMDLGVTTFMPNLMKRLRTEAPDIKLVCRQMERERYVDALAAGVADLALGTLPVGRPDLMQKKLFDDPLVCLVGQGHTGIRDRVTAKQFFETTHVSMVSPGLVEDRLSRALGKDFPRRKVAISVQHYLAIPLLLLENPFMAVVPKRTLADLLGPLFGLRAYAPPFKLPPVSIHQFWHKRSQHDAGHRWLRSMIQEP
jgi:DNA-binding transcriptional LysR family regulator